VVVGSAPLTPDEAAGLVGINALSYAAKQKGWEPLYRHLAASRERMLGGQGVAGELRDAPASDQTLMTRPDIQRLMNIDAAEALRPGAEGWADESFAMKGDWDFDPADIRCSVTWWHGDDDRNAPLSAARRAAARVPQVDLRVWHGEGHLASIVHNREIMEELLTRAGLSRSIR
jgi:pimeloyl-ACP methyl ester carboxylesterase